MHKYHVGENIAYSGHLGDMEWGIIRSLDYDRYGGPAYRVDLLIWNTIEKKMKPSGLDLLVEEMKIIDPLR